MGYLYDKITDLDKSTNQTPLQVQRNINARLGGLSLQVITGANYDSLSPKDNNTLYLVDRNGSYEVYKGTIQISGTGGDVINVKYGLRLYNYDTYAPPNHISSTASATSREGTAYAGNHDTLYTPTLTNANITVKDGGANSRFIPTTGYSNNRYVIGTPSGAISDGRSTLSLTLARWNGSIYADETVVYEIISIASRVEIIQTGMSVNRGGYPQYGLKCTRTANGTTKTWYIPNIFKPAGQEYTTFPSVNDTGNTNTTYRTLFPILTVGYLAEDIGRLGTVSNNSYVATPYLVLEIGSESLSSGKVRESASLYKLEESSEMPLGIAYDPDIGDEFQYKPQITNMIGLASNALIPAKIAAYTQDKDVT